jgi:hypothetical protein
MAKNLQVAGYPTGFAASLRTDSWQAGPLATLVVLSSFAVYVTWAALQGNHYYAAPYLSPLYSPVLFTNPGAAGAAPVSHAWFGTWPSFWPSFLPASPAILILVFPGAFRFTCYYYRKAYYRAFAGSPPGCAANPLATHRPYRGESGLLLFQNLHRIAMYFALLFVVILYYDAVQAFFRNGRFGVGVGSLVLLINATLLGGYTFGCHSFRHVIGGRTDCMSCGHNTLKYKGWKTATWFNSRHMYWAWVSLFWVGFTDVYVRLVSMGVIRDLNTW